MQGLKNIRLKRTLGGLLLAILGSSGMPAWGLEVVFKNEAAVNEENILLKDLAAFNPAGSETANRLGNLVVAAAPAPGESLNLNRQFLQYRVGPAIQASTTAATVWPESVVVQRTAQQVSAEQFEDIFKGYIRKNTPWKESEIFFARIATPGTITLPRGRLAIEVQEKTSQSYLGNVFLTALVAVNGKAIRTVSLSGEVLLQKEVLRAGRKIDRGTVITQEDLVATLEKIKELRPDFNPRPEDIVGKRATRTIQANQVLTTQMVENIPMVQKGKRVLIQADNGSIVVTALGVVQENGQQGDQVKVINVSSGKEILATVMGPGMVTVSF
jgi:flagella basal body P-ring formation protein FlgA